MRVHPNRRRNTVSDSRCADNSEEDTQPNTRPCRRTCEEPGWVTSPWSEVYCHIFCRMYYLFTALYYIHIFRTKCSVGCGMGYALREVRCMLSGRRLLREPYCFKARKPVKMRRCQNKSGCKWKVGPWKQVITRYNITPFMLARYRISENDMPVCMFLVCRFKRFT